MTYPVEIPESLFRKIESCALSEGVTVNQFFLDGVSASVEAHDSENRILESIREEILSAPPIKKKIRAAIESAGFQFIRSAE